MENVNTNAVANANVNAIGVRIPPFNPEDPTLWFAVVERSFEVSKIVQEDTKFGYIIGALDQKYQTEVRDIILNPPAAEPYTHLKKELIKRLSTSQERKTLQLLEKETLGDRKPSQFLRYLSDLAGTSVPDSMLKTIWISRLPQAMQVALAAQRDAELEKLSELADVIADATLPHPQIAEAVSLASINAQIDALLNVKMAQLTFTLREEISALAQRNTPRRGRNRSFHRGQSRSRSSSRSHSSRQSEKEYCWYHHTYGREAKKCSQPCQFNQGNEKGSH